MKPMEYMQHRPKLKRRGIIALGIIAGYAVLGFLLVPWLIEKNLPAISQSALGGREITVENIRCCGVIFPIVSRDAGILSLQRPLILDHKCPVPR